MSRAQSARRATPGPPLRAAAVLLAASLLSALAQACVSDGSPPAPTAATSEPGPDAGAVRFVKDADGSFDRYTCRARYATWIRRRFWRMTTYSPYFDSRLRCYRRAWVYRNLYAIYRGSALARWRPDWILRDARGRRLYIPFGCRGGSCPQFAGDVGNPDFRAHWIRSARATLRRGYRGIFIDDVNMLLQVGDRLGRKVAPVDRNTGEPLSLADWRERVAHFTAEIRAAFPRVEVVHNALWFAGDRDLAIRRQLAAADFVNIEHGVNDAGIRGRRGRYGLETLLDYIDRRHAAGTRVVLGDAARRPAAREYALASYFLINAGGDAIANRSGSHPDEWWRGYQTSLGAALGARRQWRGLLRRDFTRGLVVVNPPGAPRRVRRLGRRYVDVAGRRLRSVALAAASGAVLRSLDGGAGR